MATDKDSTSDNVNKPTQNTRSRNQSQYRSRQQRHSSDQRSFYSRQAYGRDRKNNQRDDSSNERKNFSQPQFDLNDQNEWPTVQQSSNAHGKIQSNNNHNVSRSSSFNDRRGDQNYYSGDNWNRGGNYRRANRPYYAYDSQTGQQMYNPNQGYTAGMRGNRPIRVNYQSGPSSRGMYGPRVRGHRQMYPSTQQMYTKVEHSYYSPMYDENVPVYPVPVTQSNQANNFIEQHYDSDGKISQETVTKQVEYYLSPLNLVNDYYIRSQMNQDGYINMRFLFNCKRIQRMKIDFEYFVEAVSKSTQLEVCEKTLVRPKDDPTKWPILHGQELPMPQDSQKDLRQDTGGSTAANYDVAPPGQVLFQTAVALPNGGYGIQQFFVPQGHQSFVPMPPGSRHPRYVAPVSAYPTGVAYPWQYNDQTPEVPIYYISQNFDPSFYDQNYMSGVDNVYEVSNDQTADETNPGQSEVVATGDVEDDKNLDSLVLKTEELNIKESEDTEGSNAPKEKEVPVSGNADSSEKVVKSLLRKK